MNKTSTLMPPEGYEWETTFLHSRRETLVILCIWGACLLWAVPYCYATGYYAAGEPMTPNELELVWGMPKWVFYGIFVPWLLADVATTLFCFFYMGDDHLGEEGEAGNSSNQPVAQENQS